MPDFERSGFYFIFVAADAKMTSLGLMLTVTPSLFAQNILRSGLLYPKRGHVYFSVLTTLDT